MLPYLKTREMRRIVILYWFLCALRMFAVGFCLPIYTLYLAAHHLNPLQMSFVNGAFWGSNLLFEVPTGALADVLGRRRCFILAGMTTTLAFFVYGMSRTFGMFCLAEVISSLGSTLASGTFQAWMKSELKHTGYDGKVTSILRYEYLANCACNACGGLVGSRLAIHDVHWPWFGGGCVVALTALLTFLLMRETYEVETQSAYAHVVTSLAKIRHGAVYTFTHAPARFILILVFLQALAVQAPNMQWQLHFATYVLSPTAAQRLCGNIQVGLNLALVLGTCAAWWFEERVGKDERELLVASHFVIGIGLLGTVLLTPFGWSLGAFYFHELARGPFKYLRDGYLNHHVKQENIRATVLSFGTLPTHIGSVIGLMLSGWIATHGSIPLAWIISASGLMIGTICLARRKA